MKALVSIFSTLLVMVVTVVMVGVGVAGHGEPYVFPLASIGDWHVGSFDTGLSLYQFGRWGHFYSLSPLNDYFVDQRGYRMPLLSALEYANKSYDTQLNRAKQKKIPEIVKGYFGVQRPYYSLETRDVKVVYATDIGEDVVNFKRNLVFPTPRYVLKQGMTVSYGTNDILVDLDTMTSYSDISNQTATYLQKYFGLTLRAIVEASRSVELHQGRLLVISQDSSSGIEVIANQGSILRIDPRYALVEIEQDVQKNTSHLEMGFDIKRVPMLEWQ